MSGALPVLADCPDCLVEGALLEVYVGSRRVEGGCRLCGSSGSRGTGARFDDLGEVLTRLAQWAREEGEPDLEVFCEANFSGLPSFEVAARVVRGERVETGFDVIAFLFPRTGAAAPARAEERHAPRALEPTLTIIPWEEPPAPTVAVEPLPPRVAFEPADPTRALWAVALADGRVDPREDAAIAAAALRLGATVIPRVDARLWRPNEVGGVREPTAVLDAMERVARIDGELDPSEIRVLREFARHWRVVVPDGRWAPLDPLRSWWSAFSRG